MVYWFKYFEKIKKMIDTILTDYFTVIDPSYLLLLFGLGIFSLVIYSLYQFLK